MGRCSAQKPRLARRFMTAFSAEPQIFRSSQCLAIVAVSSWILQEEKVMGRVWAGERRFSCDSGREGAWHLGSAVLCACMLLTQ